MARITGNIVDIPAKRVFPGAVVFDSGRIVSIQESDDVPEGSPYIMPGFVDSHVHIESTLLTPRHFAPLSLSHGVTSVVTDPHEIANVLGVRGVEFMLEDASGCHFNFHFGAPSCVPSTPFETSGATLSSSDVRQLLSRDDIYGLCEMMNVPGLMSGDPEVLAKLGACTDAGKVADGHMPGASAEAVDECVLHGISTDHECSDIQDARFKLSRGVRILIREGSAACNYDSLCPLLAEDRWQDMLMFCTDDKYVNELKEGYIDALVRESVRRGFPLWNILKAACVNPVLHYGLNDGLLRPGDKADFIVVDSLTDFNVLEAYVDGVKASFDASATASEGESTAPPNNFNALELSPEDLRVEPQGRNIRLITASDGSLLTGCAVEAPLVVDGNVVSDPARDILKIIVNNRYEPAQKPAIGFIRGFALKKGAIACSIGHDSHNVTAIGVSDEQIARVVNAVVASKGGMAVSDADGVATLPLEVAGLMSSLPGEEVAAKFEVLLRKARQIGCPFNAPFMTMAFMSLPVIPDLKITDKGLFDVLTFSFSPIFASDNP